MVQTEVRLRLMVVEDDEEVREMLALALAPDWEVMTAADGEEALHLLPEADPDLLIVDVMMPKMDGLTLVREVRSHERHHATPVVFLTALSSRRDAIAGYESGCDVYLTKPLDIERLRRNLQVIVRDRNLTPRPRSGGCPAASKPSTESQRAPQHAADRSDCHPHMLTDSLERPRVLVVEDNRDFIDVLNQYLQSEFEIFVAHTGAEALERIPAIEPDLITVDLAMPKMSGFQLIELIRAAPEEAKTPIIVITAHATSTSLKRIRRAGADELFEKPADLPRLRETMRALLRAPGRRLRWPKTNPTLSFSRAWRP